MKVKNKNCSSIKTKEKIRNAFVESLKEDGSLANISVTKLVKKADISRSTFYTHYESIYDIAKELQDETLELIAIDDSDIKSIDDLDKYMTSASKSNSNSTNNSSSNANNTVKNITNNTEEYELISQGNIGVTSSAELLEKWRAVLINIDEMIFKELENLFLFVY